MYHHRLSFTCSHLRIKFFLNISIIMDLLYWILEMNEDLEKMKRDIEEMKKDDNEATHLSK